jgi:DNA replication protein DnaC
MLDGSNNQKEPNLSKMKERPINLKRRDFPFVGRRKLIYDILSKLTGSMKIPIQNIFGEPGSGKTELLHELGNYAYQRNYFRSIFYFSLKSLASIEALKQLFNEYNLSKVISNKVRRVF